MYRFIAIVWDSENGEAAAAAQRIEQSLPANSRHAWREVLRGQGVLALDAGGERGAMRAMSFSGGGGVVLGRIFRKGAGSRAAAEPDIAKCLATKGRHLADEFWGRYVAIFSDPADGVCVLRDPSGAFPCFNASWRGVRLYFSDIQDAADLRLMHYTVNWRYLAANLMFPQLQKTRTGLNEVEEVLPGECVRHAGGGRERWFVWDPAVIAEGEIPAGPVEASRTLRETVMDTIAALSGDYESIVLSLGGLDSSIVLACIARSDSRPDITCVNFHTASPRGDERRYSRLAAAKYDAPLVEIELDWRNADITKFFHLNRTARPPAFFDCIGMTGDLLNVARSAGAGAAFYGVGGDSVFFQMPYSLGALDYIRRRGFGRDFARVWFEASRYSRTTLAKTLGAVLREALAPAPCYEQVHRIAYAGQSHPLVNPEFLADIRAETCLHPMLLPAPRALKGKFLHILVSALFSIDYYDPWDTQYDLERIYACLSQPIVEQCLRTPVWLLTYGGVDRGLARHAFRQDLPPEVAMRHSKSTPTTFYDDIYTANRKWIADVLLDGVLVREKILLREKLEAALREDDVRAQTRPHDMLTFLSVETWLQGWEMQEVS